jgi:hypothetical protein
MKTLARFAVAAFLMGAVSTTVHAGGLINEPLFNRDGNGDRCIGASGNRVTCNKWFFQDMRGWERKCVSKGENVLGVLPTDVEGMKLEARRSRDYCFAAYHSHWADFHDWNQETEEALFEELKRPLRQAKAWQLFSVPRDGTYRFRTCMVSKFYVWAQESGPMSESGISVRLEQKHEEPGRVTVHAELPEKAKFGSLGDDGEHIQWVSSFDALPEKSRRGRVFGTNDYRDAYVWDGTFFHFVGSEGQYSNDFVDGYRGHAGEKTAYFNQFTDPEGLWSCYSKRLRLEKGFYEARVEANPTRWDGGENFPDFTEYEGLGVVREVSLKPTR